MLPALAVLLVFQLAGEALCHALAIPIPGPVVGMLGLLAVLILRGLWAGEDAPAIPEDLERATAALLGHLSLLFVPAGVGVTTHLALLATEAVPIAVALIGSSLAAIAAAGLLMTRLEHRERGG